MRRFYRSILNVNIDKAKALYRKCLLYLGYVKVLKYDTIYDMEVFMTITFTLDKKDYIDFNLYHIQYSEVTKKKLNSQRLMGSISFIGLGLVSLFMGGGQSQVIFAIIIMEYGAFWYYHFPSFAQKRIQKSTEKAIEKGKLKDLFDEITIEINDEGLVEHNKHGNHKILWTDVIEVVYLNEYIYAFLKDQGAMVLPHRVLDEEALNNLKEIIETNYKGELTHLEITLS